MKTAEIKNKLLHNMHKMSVPLLMTLILVPCARTAEQFDKSGRESRGLNKIRIMYDVTSLIHPDFENTRKWNASTDVFSDTNDTGIFYYETNVDMFNGACDKSFDSYKHVRQYSCGGTYAMDGISVIFNGKASRWDLLNISASLEPFRKESILTLLENNNSFLESVIISFAYNSSDCICSSAIDKLTSFFELIFENRPETRMQQSRVKLGLEMNANFLKCCYQQQFNVIRYVNHITLRIELTPLTTMLSNGLFFEMVNDIASKYRDYVQKQNPHGTVYIRLVTKNWKNTIREGGYTRYEALVAKFVNAWTFQQWEYSNQVIILPTPYKNVTISDQIHFIRKTLLPRIDGQQASMPDAESREILKYMHSTFNNVLLVNPSSAFLKNVMNTENISTSLLFIYGKGMNLTNANKTINYSLNTSSFVNITAVTLDRIFLKNYLNVRPLLNTLVVNNVTIGCYVAKYFGNLQKDFDQEIINFMRYDVKTDCLLYNVSSQVLLQFSLHITTNEELILFLGYLQKAKNIFEQEFVGANLIPSIRFDSLGAGETFFQFKSDILPHSFYCNPKLKQANEYHQTILSFANIHKWRQLILEPLSDHRDDFGLWRNIETDNEILRKVTSFSVLARSNSEKSLGDGLFMTFDCIEWTANAKQGGIQFLANEYTGATFNSEIKQGTPLESRELQTLLLFALTRFSFVEMTGVNMQKLKQLSGVLTENLFKSIKIYRHISGTTTGSLVYIEMPLQKGEDIKHEVWSLASQNYISVHVTGWESLSKMEMKAQLGDIRKMSAMYSGKFGITVQNCIHEMNLGLSRLKNMSFIKFASYLVCKVKPVTPRNSNRMWMEEYFGTLFYTKVYMERFLSTEGIKKEVIFRIDLVSEEPKCSEKKDTSMFLSFLNDMNQHSASYKVRYFIVRAFGNEDANQECPICWWRLKDYSDLSNVSAYVDIENEYFGLPTKLEVPLPQPEVMTDDSTSIYWGVYILIGVLNVGALVLVVLFVVWLQRRCNKNRVLSPTEVNNFYSLIHESCESMELLERDHEDTSYMKFNREHEMSVEDIKIQDVVGRGQFGVVHKGIYQNRITVAIKIPRRDCGKDQFKSALSELKILCYVGSHPNIVSFLGAYTKEISKGKVLIVTEFCDMGSLESYLRSVDQPDPQQQINGGNNCTFDTKQLYQFSHQIASGMEYVAEKRIIHGDLATRNVLLTSDCTCKISDFGLSRRLYEHDLYVKKGNEALPWMWMAPESLKFMEFTTKSDVWGYGVTLWEIFSLGKVPCPGMRLSEDYVANLERGVRMGRAQFASQFVHQKMLQCWSLSQEERPTFTELKQ